MPRSLETYFEKAEDLADKALEAESNPFRTAVTTYLHSAGVEGGYGFFAPYIPDTSKLVFELRYADGHVDYELARANDVASGLRLISLLDYIGETDYEPLRQVMLKMLAYSVWEEHRDATTIRAVYGFILEPSPREAKQGAKESYHFLYAYDFSFQPESAASPPP